MHELIRIATRELATFLSRHLPALGPRWWATQVEEQLTVRQQQWVHERGLTKLEQLDLAALLQIVDRNWYELSVAAKLPREGRNWVRELKSVRNKTAHESAEPASPDDLFRDADTLSRCLKMLRATRQSLADVEAVKSAALDDMTAARTGGATSSEPPPTPTMLDRQQAVPNPTGAVGRVEIRDHVLWTKHIRDDEALKATLNALSEGNQIDLKVDDCRGTWQKMDDGRNGQPTPGIKPVGPTRSHWHTLVQDKLGSVVTIALASEAHNAAMGQDKPGFEAVWAEIQRKLAPGDAIRNWSRHSGYRGNDLTIRAVQTRFVEIDSPGAENIQHIGREHFARVHEHWNAYAAGVFARSRLRDITRFSTYVISVLHHVLENDGR